MFLDQGLPTSVDFVRNEPCQFVASYSTSTCSIIDTETGAEVIKLDSNRTYGECCENVRGTTGVFSVLCATEKGLGDS